MAIKNSVYVYIDGINRSANAVLPISYGEFLDERLDECTISLRATKKPVFAPLTPVTVTLINERYIGTGKNRKVLERIKNKKYYLVANDNATETQIGSGRYNHELSLIETTKIAECVVADTLTYTNDIGRNYAENSSLAVLQWE